MRYPAFIAELGTESYRRRLLLGVWSGYVLAAAFLALALLANVEGLLPYSPWIYSLVAAKLVTNTAALWSLRRNFLALELSGVNVVADIAVMTGAIYLTGGVLSPLLAMYVIEIAVIALLTNLGTTLLVALSAMLLYSAMALLVQMHVLPAWPPPVAWSRGLTPAYVATALVYAAVVLGVPTFFTAAILRQLKARERALELRTEQLIEAGRQKAQFMANVTHELRTPIHGILGLAGLVEEGIYGATTDKQLAAMHDVKTSAKALLHLIDDLLELSHADAGKLELEPSEVDLAEVLEGVVSSIRWMQGTKAVDLEVELAPDLPRITTDRRKLVQIVLNILANAVKFTPEGGKIRLAARRQADRVLVAVTDTGVGIPAEELPHIFDEFRQVDGSTSREYGGVGLGLALVRRLSKLLGGDVQVESEPDAGSIFTVTLPVTPPASAGVLSAQ